MSCAVYKFTCGPFYYIGSSVVVEDRLLAHQRDLEAGGHVNRDAIRAYREFGWGGSQILVECPREELDEWEERMIEADFGDPFCLNKNRRVYPRRRTFGRKKVGQ